MRVDFATFFGEKSAPRISEQAVQVQQKLPRDAFIF